VSEAIGLRALSERGLGETPDFLMCGRCGVYVGAHMEQAGRYYAIANSRTLESEGELGTVQPMDCSCEGVDERRMSRVSRWTFAFQ
jgi:hypothetical protein